MGLYLVVRGQLDQNLQEVELFLHALGAEAVHVVVSQLVTEDLHVHGSLGRILGLCVELK